MRSTDSGSSRMTRSGADSEWLMSAARLLGRAARFARLGADRIADAAHAPARRKRPRAGETVSLIRRLARLVSAHAADGYASLARDPAFWTTVEQLAAMHTMTQHERRKEVACLDADDVGARSPLETLPSAAEPAPLDVAEPTPTDESDLPRSDVPPESGTGAGSKDS